MVKGVNQNNSNSIYANGFNYGYDYQSNAAVVSLVNTMVNANDPVTQETIEQPLANGESSYKSYYWMHRSGHNDLWYNAGQLLDTQPSALQAAGIRSVISFRTDGEPTTRLASEPTTGSVDNHEFSDINGNYNVSAERLAVEQLGVKFFHLPLPSGAESTWTRQTYETYLPALKEAESLGPVLSHCASGYRSAAYSIAYLADKSGLCSDWALREAGFVGLYFDNSDSSSTDQQVVDFFHQVLNC